MNPEATIASAPEAESTRIALGIEYDGSGYAGWQAQRCAGLNTLQETLQQALSRVADSTVRVHCAGRTDAGVHALAQVVHFDTQVERPLRAWVQGSNSLLPPGIAVQWARRVDKSFHARFSATHRRYRYLILNRAQRSPLLCNRSFHVRAELDTVLMHESGQCLLGERDFSAFRAAGCQSRSAMRRLDLLSVTRAGELVAIEVQANAFLLHMVRNIAGALVAIGCGERPVTWLRELLESRDRRLGAPTAPAQGLCLVEVGYADSCCLPTAGFPSATPTGAPGAVFVESSHRRP